MIAGVEEAAPQPVAEMSFEEALGELETVVSALEDGKVPLADSIALYQRGAELRTRCESLLRDAELKVSRIVAGGEGAVALEDVADAGTPLPPAEPPRAAPAANRPPASDDDIPF
ncbi:MAG: exodeoxyribonuclease VII small subunit [Pikeienuella sp.]